MAKLIIEAARLRVEDKELQDLIADLRQPRESKEIRFGIGNADFKGYGQTVLDHLKGSCTTQPDWQLVSPNYEGVRIACTSPDERGWLLLRQSLHDPVLPLNIESDVDGGVARIEHRVMKLLAEFRDLKR